MGSIFIIAFLYHTDCLL